MDEVQFGRYRLSSLLGEGGMGEVWRAHDTVTDRTVAIKVLSAKLSKDEEFQRRFRREAQAAARLETPHVVPIYDYGEIDGRLFVCMRLIKGRDLAAVLADGPLEPARAVRIIGQVAEALHAAHEIGLIHRDIKPSKILLDDRDFAYLIDFGIARVADDTRMTKTGNTIGTFAYIAPERLDGQGHEDARVDIYSLACVLYECLAGEPPFGGDTMARLVFAHVNDPPPRPSIARPDVPEPLDEVIATGMAKHPDQRYASTVELATAAHDAITTPPAPHSEHNLLDGQTAPAPAPAPAARQQSAAPTQPADGQRLPTRPPVPPPRLPDRPPPAPGTPPQRRWWRRKPIMIPAALVTVAVIATAIVITVTTGQRHENSNGPQTALPTSTQSTLRTTSTQHREPAYGPQVTLPFTGLHIPDGVAVDAAGTLYVVDVGNNRVVKLAAGSSGQVVLPFSGLNLPGDVAVDAAGDLYVTDYDNSRVLKLAAGSSDQVVLPFTGLYKPHGVAVDAAGNVYVVDHGNSRVLKLAAGSATQEVLPFSGLNIPGGMAVDGAGNVYVVDYGNKRVVKLAAGSDTQTVLLFTGLKAPFGVAVDGAGNVYVADNDDNRVLKLAAGSSTQSVLPFTGLSTPDGVAVDAAGNLYVTTYDNKVLKLPVV